MRVNLKVLAVIVIIFLVLLLALGSSSASRQDDVEVDFNSPKGNDIDVNTKIEVHFSERMDQELTEQAFSLRKVVDGPKLQGGFSWNDKNLTFSPDSRLESGKTYSITITSSAKSISGKNLNAINWEFTTKKVANNEQKDDDWWKTWEPIVTIATILGTATAAGIGYYKIRKKRGQLRKYMIKIDNTYDEHRKDPQVCENRLVSLKEWLKVKVKQGMVDEYHYLILDKKIDDYLQDIRFRKSLPKPKIIKGVEKDIQAELEKKMKEQDKEKSKDKPEKPKEQKKPPRPKIIAD